MLSFEVGPNYEDFKISHHLFKPQYECFQNRYIKAYIIILVPFLTLR